MRKHSPVKFGLLGVLAWLPAGCGYTPPPVAGACTWFAYHEAASLALEKKDWAQVIRLEQPAIEASAQIPNSQMQSLAYLAEAKAESGDFKGLEGLFTRGELLARTYPGLDLIGRSDLLKARARYYFLAYKDALAEADNRAVIEMLRDAPPAATKNLGLALVQMAELKDRQNRPDEAGQWFQAARRVLETNRGDFLAARIDMLERALLFYVARDRREDESAVFMQLFLFTDPCTRPGATADLKMLLILARCCKNHGRPAQAANFYQRASQAYAGIYGATDPGSHDLARRALALREGRP